MNHNNALKRALFISLGREYLERSESYSNHKQSLLRHSQNRSSGKSRSYSKNHEIKQCCHFFVNKCKNI